MGSRTRLKDHPGHWTLVRLATGWIGHEEGYTAFPVRQIFSPMQELPVARHLALRNLHKIQNGVVRALDTTQWETISWKVEECQAYNSFR